jgi:prophage regulatory protein
MKESASNSAAVVGRKRKPGQASSNGLFRLPRVMAKVGMSRSWIYAGGKAGTFPKPVHIGPKAVGWLAEEIEQYIEDRAASRSGVATTTEAQ